MTTKTKRRRMMTCDEGVRTQHWKGRRDASPRRRWQRGREEEECMTAGPRGGGPAEVQIHSSAEEATYTAAPSYQGRWSEALFEAQCWQGWVLSVYPSPATLSVLVLFLCFVFEVIGWQISFLDFRLRCRIRGRWSESSRCSCSAAALAPPPATSPPLTTLRR